MLLYFKVKTLLTCFILGSSLCFGQLNTLSIKNIDSTLKIEIFTFYGMKTEKAGEFSYANTILTLPENYTGFIRLKIDSNYEDFIFDNASTVIEIKSNDDSTLSFTSDSYQNFLLKELKKKYLQYSDKIKNETDTKQKEYLTSQRMKFVDSILSIDSTSFFSLSTKYAMLPLNGKTYTEIIDLIPLKNNLLIHCSVIPKMILGAMRSINKQDDEILEKLLRYLYKKEFDPEVKEMINSFLIEFFTETHSERILSFLMKELIGENYCTTTLSESANTTIKRIELQQPGNVLPNVKLNNESFLRILKKYKKKNIAIVIWSMDCPHCLQMIERLNKNKDSSLIYIGIELSVLPELKGDDIFDISFKEKNGWESEIVKKWMINKTPTVIITDNKLKIISLPEDL